MTITIDLRLNLGLGAIATALADPQGLHEAISAGVEVTVGDHVSALNSRSPHTGFYAAAARGIEAEADADAALIRIPKLGFALRYYGGAFRAGQSVSSHTGQPTKALAIPTDDVPIVGATDGRRRQRPAEAGLLAFLPGQRGSHTVGYLVEGEEKPVTRGKNKGRTRIAPKPGGLLLYILMDEVTQRADPSVLPAEAELRASAGAAITDFLGSFPEGGQA